MRLHAGVLIATVGLAAALIWAALEPALPPGVLATELERLLPRTGAANPVTGVLLGYRAYDTLLEVAVLLVAVIASGAAHAAPGSPARDARAKPDPVLRALINVLVPVMVLVAGYFLWAGTHAPGGAFQAAAVLAAGGVLLHLAQVRPAPDPQHPAVRGALAGGLAFFLAVFYFGALAGALLALEAALTVSIALALLCLFSAPGR